MEIIKNYLKFRTGNITGRKWIDDAADIAEQRLTVDNSDITGNLLKAQVAILNNNKELAKLALDESAKYIQDSNPKNVIAYCYYLYLAALYKNEYDFTNEAKKKIEQYYEGGHDNWQILWILFNMDSRYDENPSLKYTLIKRMFNKGCTSPVMYYEAAKIINKQPELLRVMNRFEIQVLNFAGKYAVLTTGNRRLGISSKLNKEQKAHYKELLHEFDTERYGLIIRTNAASVADETLIAEIRSLEMEWSQMRENACHKTCYSVLKKARPAYLEDVKNQREGSVSEIITDDRELFETICMDYGIHPKQFMTNGSVPVPVDQFQVPTISGTADSLTLTYYHDPMLTLSSLYSVKSSLEKALREQIWLKSGASIVLQHTEALTVIDVNSGKNIIKKEMRENLLRINLEAAKEIAYQLRLRNISGIIIIDFINLLAKEDEAVLLKEFRTYLKDDPVKTDLIDMTKLGLVEVTRKKIRKSLRDSLKMN